MSALVNEIDHRYSRQAYTIGKELSLKLGDAHILLLGYNELSEEIIKNLVLTGIGKLTICPRQDTQYQNINSIFVSSLTDIPLQKIQSLNPNITIEIKDMNDILQNIDSHKITAIIQSNEQMNNNIFINNIARQNSIPYISAFTTGLYGYIFNDFGNEWVVNDINDNGETLEPLQISQTCKNIIDFKEKHELSKRNNLIITDVNNKKYCVKILDVKTPLTIATNINLDNINVKTIEIKKESKTFNFNSLETVLNTSSKNELFYLNLALQRYYNTFNSYPASWNINDYNNFKNILTGLTFMNINENLIKKFCYCSNGLLPTCCSIIAGYVSFEVLKVIGHKYTPIKHFQFYNFYDLIPDEMVINYTEDNPNEFYSNDKYSKIVNIFGNTLYNKIRNKKSFIIGSGALGCELLKNLTLLNTQTITITDPDHIEKSNLSRQFFFNDSDIGKNKAETSSKKARLLNDNLEIITFTDKLSDETDEKFNNKFYENVDVLLGALDNIDARKFIDSKCIRYGIPYIDSGTMGAQASVKCVIPNLTENLTPTLNSSETSIPICTIKSFPTKVEHTIQWGRELFEQEFNVFPQKMLKLLNQQINFNELADHEITDLYNLVNKYNVRELNALTYTIILNRIYQENFHDNIYKLKKEYEGKEELYTKKFPTEIDRSKNVEYIDAFYRSGFKLLNQMYNLNIEYNNLNSSENMMNQELTKTIVECIENHRQYNLQLVEFEKDDDDLGHIEFITACVNLRNEQYEIPKTDLFQVRKIAGKIIPAMITTTSIASGYQTMEYIKLATFEDYTIETFKDRFINTIFNNNTEFEPVKNESIWLNYTIDNDMDCVMDIVNHINEKSNRKISFMMYNGQIIYDEGNVEQDKIEVVDDSPIIMMYDDNDEREFFININRN